MAHLTQTSQSDNGAKARDRDQASDSTVLATTRLRP